MSVPLVHGGVGGEEIEEAVTDTPEPEGDIFKDFPAEGETMDSSSDSSEAGGAKEDEDKDKKVDPFANTELED